MTYTAVVTFEYMTRSPETARLAVEAGGPQTAAMRAIRAAKRQICPIGWTSMVCLLERHTVSKEEEI